MAIKILKDFEEYLIKEGKMQKTIISYTGDVKMFLDYLKDKGIAFNGNLNRFYITSYKDHLLKENYTISTINKKINSLNAFNQFLIQNGLCHERAVAPNKDKIKIAKGSEGEVEIYSDEEIENILFYISDNNKVSQRDKLTIMLLLFTGVRVSELVNIKIADVDLLSLTLRIVGKGGKYREVPIKIELKDAIKEYMEGERKEHKLNQSEYLLLTQRAEKMDKDTVNKLLRKHGKKLNIIMKPHKFRHTFCTRLIRKGVDLTTVAKLAGHANIQTTAQFYINTSREDKQRAIELL